MRFAAAADTASFIAAAGTVLEPGDVPSVVAAATADATLEDIGFVIASTLVILAKHVMSDSMDPPTS